MDSQPTKDQTKLARCLRRRILDQRRNSQRPISVRVPSKRRASDVASHSVVNEDGSVTTNTNGVVSTTVEQVQIKRRRGRPRSVSVVPPSVSPVESSDGDQENYTRKYNEVWDFGDPNWNCEFCGAIVWYEERTAKSKRPRDPQFSICCQAGLVELPRLRDAPLFLDGLLDYTGPSAARKFRDNIRAYNSMFSFTSMGGTIDKKINDGRGPYVFRINGQNHHRIGSLLPMEGKQPKFTQLYIYDTENEVTNRLTSMKKDGKGAKLDTKVINGLINMLDRYNVLIKAFRTARDRFRDEDIFPVRLRIVGSRDRDARQYNLPTSSEIAALIVGDGVTGGFTRDIVVEHKEYGLKRIDEAHPSFMALQYPLLFPYGEDGYTEGIRYREAPHIRKRKRNTLSVREYYAFRVQQRLNEGHTLIRGGRLFQQYLVDAYTCIEEERLSWVKSNQKKLRSDLYKGLQDAVIAGDTNAVSIGKRYVLPSSFTGGPRYMVQNYQDAIAICRFAGAPSFFITFTCNPRWKEIDRFLRAIPGQKPEDRPDVVTRVFKIKLDQLMDDLRRGNHFGRVTGAIYTIEFQKRGLPHAHIFLFLEHNDRPTTPAEINKLITAELPDQSKDPLAYDTVVQFMVHGPCGSFDSKSPCMIDKRCTKNYPKKFCKETNIDKSGFPVYRRRDNSRTALKNGVEIDNKWVVPHNLDLIVKYQAHINVEYCNQTRAVKYLFKYINKGGDKATIVLEENNMQTEPNGQQTVQQVDEVKRYLDCRYISASESSWRIFEFGIQFRDPAVQRLAFHLPDEQPVIFQESDDLNDVAQRDDLESTKFLKWMDINNTCEDARSLTYVDFPTRWVWKQELKNWKRRDLTKGKRVIGRVYYAHPTSGERFYLRLLLNYVKGPRTYEDLRSVDGVLYPTFQSACCARGLLDDDSEWHEALEEAGHWSSGQLLREMFVTVLLYCEVTDPLALWNSKWGLLSDDIQQRQRRILQDNELILTEDQLRNYALYEIEKILNRTSNSLKNFTSMPFPNMSFRLDMENRLIREETFYDHDTLLEEFTELHAGLNIDQLRVFDAVTQAVYSNSGGFFFVYGSGGTGKTYLWTTIISKLRSEGKIVLAVASSGIASLLLPGGRTAHSRFKIPIEHDENSCCNIKQQSNLADLIRKADLIIWDEAPMNHRNSFEALDRSLRDILRLTTPGSEDKVFGGKTMLLGGDFRQCLPVIPNGSRETIVGASINKSSLWSHCQVFVLSINMRLRDDYMDHATREKLSDFSKWILDLGNGDLPAIASCDGEDPSWIKIPNEFLIPSGDDSIEQIVASTYPDFSRNYDNADYIKDRCILVPTNECADKVNKYMVSGVPGQAKDYYSADSISKISEAIANQDVLYPMEFLNSLQMSGMPSHEMQLKVGVPIMLLRNIDVGAGLCNGTRLIVTRMEPKVLQAQILTGTNVGTRVIIHRIIMTKSEMKWPFVLRRTQFPIKICYAMTINKSQGQTLKRVGIYMPRPVFSHGQLYVAVSRTSSREGLKILLVKQEDEPDGYTQNIVYKEVFNNLPV